MERNMARNGAEKYVFSFSEDHIRRALVAVARSTMHRIVGDYSADEILTGKREEIALAALKEMKEAIKPFDAGIDITNLQLQRVTPPDVVKPSFDQVNASIQQRDQSVNEARRERNSLIPMARAGSDKLIREAEGLCITTSLGSGRGDICVAGQVRKLPLGSRNHSPTHVPGDHGTRL